MAFFPKPAEGSWTEHFGLDKTPVSYEDSISPEHYELERDAIFRRTWLNVGRVEQLPRKGSYFTKELDAARTSVIILRDTDGEVRAFYNICRHRGNKLVWQDFPREETAGTCRQFTCKYHGWRYGLKGDLTFVQQEEEFFDLDKSKFGLAPVRAEVWEGFIFVNLDSSDSTPLAEYLGDMGAGLAGYPFHEMTQVTKFRAEIGANWKLFIDAFAEFYHAPVLHGKQAVAEESKKLSGYGYEALAYQIDGPHSMVSSWGGMSPPKDENMVKPIERKVRSGLFGPWDRPIDFELPPGANPARSKAWGVDSFVFFPNFMILLWAPNWYLTYHYWPTSYNTHIFEGGLYFVPPKNARERLGQELAAVTFKEYALQDGNTLEATQTMLESRAVTEFPLNDQEVLLRHLHVTARRYVEDYKSQRSAKDPVTAIRSSVAS
jgi:phenylpropionate dioxygenase-like ring-hydroxylating dioxygenase large terminal subunit